MLSLVTSEHIYRLGSPTKEGDSPVEVDKEKFDLNNEEFPELSLSVKVIYFNFICKVQRKNLLQLDWLNKDLISMSFMIMSF